MEISQKNVFCFLQNCPYRDFSEAFFCSIGTLQEFVLGIHQEVLVRIFQESRLEIILLGTLLYLLGCFFFKVSPVNFPGGTLGNVLGVLGEIYQWTSWIRSQNNSRVNP